jgi:hypothetical protein
MAMLEVNEQLAGAYQLMQECAERERAWIGGYNWNGG